MRLGIRPLVFLGRLLVFFFLTYLLWRPVEPVYTQLLATLTRGFLHVTESIADPHGQVTIMNVRETQEGRRAIFFAHREFLDARGEPVVQSGIPAEWVQANIVLLIPLMLATPAGSWRQRFTRLALALALAIALQVLDIAVTVKATYASFAPAGYGAVSRWVYQFGDAFTQSLDTQLFPVMIWAGIHFEQLLGAVRPNRRAPASQGRANVIGGAVPPPRRQRKRAKAARSNRSNP